MKKSKKKVSVTGIGFLGALALLFIALKLTGHIHWHWIWVLTPLWGGLALIIGVTLLFLLVIAILAILSVILDKKL